MSRIIRANNWLAALLFLLRPATLSAAEINGTVRSVTDKYATVVTESDLMPTPGDKATIFFQLPGDEAEVSVANGHVSEITGRNIMVEIDEATGTMAAGQRVRITSNKATTGKGNAVSASSPATQPAVSTTPAASAEDATRILVGRWAGKTLDGLKATVVFKSDGTLVVPLQQTEGGFVSGQYSIDSASEPPRVTVTGIKVVAAPQSTDEELKSFEYTLDLMRRLNELRPGFVFDHQSARYLAQPVREALLRSVWIGEIDDPTHMRIQGFTDAPAGVRPKLGPTAAVLTKLAPREEGPIADFYPPR